MSIVNRQIRRAILRTYRELFARPQFLKINQFVVRLGMSGLGILNYENHHVSGEDAFLRAFAHHHRQPVILDVGANVGAYSERAMSHAPQARIWAFEPHPTTFRTLERTAKRVGFQAVHAGCGQTAGKLELFDYAAGDGSAHASLYSNVLRDLHHADDVVGHLVDIIALDSFLEDHDIDYVHLLKVDTEGHELQVLRGAERAIRDKRIETIQFEFNEMNVESRVFFKDIATLLSDYAFFRMLPSGLMPMGDYDPWTWEVFAYQNVVAKLKSTL